MLYFIYPMCCTFYMKFGLAIPYILFQQTHETEIEYRRNTQQAMIIRTRSLNSLLNARDDPMFFDHC